VHAIDSLNIFLECIWDFLFIWPLFLRFVATQEIWHTIDGVYVWYGIFPGRSWVGDANEYKQNTASRKDYAWHKNKL